MSNIPGAFIIRKLHSFVGFWLVLFLFEHLLTNSQAALYFADHESGFVYMVNAIQAIPYLHVIEIILLGFPLLIHMLWGFVQMRSAKYNVFPSNGTKPFLWKNARNRAYTWQRISAWILAVGIIGHVVQMRFLDYPSITTSLGQEKYVVRVHKDEGLKALATKLHVELYDKEKNQVVAVTNSFGVASLLSVRDTFKNPFFAWIYSAFVLSAIFHAANGLWTCLISWGITITERSQTLSKRFCIGFMILLGYFGFSSIWGVYFFA
ncbi:MAG: DUF1691 domain-containing protein [Chlamydiales bacterium]|nr:DUF1691 domain-containing protein [Chlamydiales bacterium]